MLKPWQLVGFGDDLTGDEFEYGGRLSGRWLVVCRFGIEDKGCDAGARRGDIDDG